MFDKKSDNPAHETARLIAKALFEQGLVMEAGVALASAVLLPSDTDDEAKLLLRDSFFGGAQHLWTCIMAGLEPGHEVTAADERRIDMIGKELEAWAKDLDKRYPRRRAPKKAN